MQQLMGNSGEDNEDEAKLARRAPESPDAVGRLPKHLRHEMATYMRVEAIRRRDDSFAHCSHEFMIALVASMKGKMVLLSEDDYIPEGQPLPDQLALVVDGELEVLVNGVVSRHLRVGDLINKEYFLKHVGAVVRKKYKFGIRAETTCTLMTGFENAEDIQALNKRFPKDLRLLYANRGTERASAA